MELCGIFYLVENNDPEEETFLADFIAFNDKFNFGKCEKLLAVSRQEMDTFVCSIEFLRFCVLNLPIWVIRLYIL